MSRTPLMQPSNFYPRPPRGGRRPISRWPFSAIRISIHALREEGDFCTEFSTQMRAKFLSTPSARRATKSSEEEARSFAFLSTPSARRATGQRWCHQRRPRGISIHALREEGDFRFLLIAVSSKIFLSTPSARRATKLAGGTNVTSAFLSTPSARRATPPLNRFVSHSIFLSTPSARRATPADDNIIALTLHFYPRPPRGGRLPVQRPSAARRHFYPRPPRGGRLLYLVCCTPDMKFLSTPSARRATSRPAGRSAYNQQFLSTPSARRATQHAGGSRRGL